MYLIDRSRVIGGRVSFWNEERTHFMYYQSGESRWAITVREESASDPVEEYLRGSTKGLAFECGKGEPPAWSEYVQGEWQRVLTNEIGTPDPK